jgi:hypothetical protein
MSLSTRRIDARTFFEENDISLTCLKCKGEGCDDCNEGYLEIMWNTIVDTDFPAGSDYCPVELPHDFGGVVAFEFDGNIWLGLSACGMDMSPYYCKAWLELFPDVGWLPTQWINSTNLYGGYYQSTVGPEWAKKIIAKYGETLEMKYQAAKIDRKRLKEFLKAEREDRKTLCRIRKSKST